jgi:hypothetical protein
LLYPTKTLSSTEWDWWRIARWALPFAVAFGAVVRGESVLVAKSGIWLPGDCFQVGEGYTSEVSAVGLWLRLCVIGAGAFFSLKSLGRSPGDQFLLFWILVCLGLALSLMAVDFWSYQLQFVGSGGSSESTRWSWLATLYVRVALYYIATRLLLGASCVGRNRGSRLAAAWTATTTMQSMVWFLALLIIKLFVDGVLVNLISFAPVIAPFWFIPDELSPMRYFAGYGIDILAQSCGVFFYIAFWIAADRRFRAPVPESHPRE